MAALLQIWHNFIFRQFLKESSSLPRKIRKSVVLGVHHWLHRVRRHSRFYWQPISLSLTVVVHQICSGMRGHAYVVKVTDHIRVQKLQSSGVRSSSSSSGNVSLFPCYALLAISRSTEIMTERGLGLSIE